MPSTRRSVLAATVTAGSLLAGCNGGQSAANEPEYKVYVRNETSEPYQITVRVLDENDAEVYEATGDGVLTPNEAQFFGPFADRPATIRVVAESLHEDQDPKTWSKSYQPPEEACTKFVLNRLFLKADSAEYDTKCSEH